MRIVFLIHSLKKRSLRVKGKVPKPIYAAQYGSHWSHESIEHFRYAQSKLNSGLSVEYTLDFEDVICGNIKYLINTFFFDYIVKRNNLDIFN